MEDIRRGTMDIKRLKYLFTVKPEKLAATLISVTDNMFIN